MIKTYLLLTKPGIIMGNALAAIAGFFLASRGIIDIGLLIAAFSGLSLIIASACVFNNFIDRGIDAKMHRTKKRAVAAGLVTGKQAVIFATLLGLFGTAVLSLFTNTLTVIVALTGFFFYVVMYSFWKRRSEYGTLVGSISGAVPPVVGYTAVSNQLDLGAFLLFLLLVLWQMPHFYAIAMYRVKDYAAASIPVLPVLKGMYLTKLHIFYYVIAFIGCAGLFTVFGYTGFVYSVVMTVLGFIWLIKAYHGFKTDKDIGWARDNFKFSLVVLTAFCLLIMFDALLP